MPAGKNWIMLLKNKAFEDKATELKINNLDIDKVDPKKLILKVNVFLNVNVEILEIKQSKIV